MALARQILVFALQLYVVLLLGRLVFDWIQMFAREWRPKGPILVAAEAIYSATDPPLRAVRRVIPPLRLGGMALDLSFMVVLLLVYVLISLLGSRSVLF